MAEIEYPFAFKQCVSILKATGKKAKDLRELRSVISSVSSNSVFHHTCQYFLKEHIHEYTNDFAHWAGEGLEERALAEHLSSIDPYDFADIEQVRSQLLRVIDDYLERFPEPREAMKGDEFYFNETLTFTFPAGVRAQNLAEFLMGIKFVDHSCIYFHYYEARMRLASGVDDFSAWLEDVLMNKELAERIRSIDPFMHTVEGIREHIAEAVEQEVRKNMEAINQ